MNLAFPRFVAGLPTQWPANIANYGDTDSLVMNENQLYAANIQKGGDVHRKS